MAGLGASLVGFTVIYGILLQALLPLATVSDRWEALRFAFSHSLRNFLPLLSPLFRFAPYPEGQKSWYYRKIDELGMLDVPFGWFAGLGILQTIIGSVLLFLLLLGLRNRFRLK